MALFRGTIENQIGTLNQVNEQVAKQKAMEQEIAMKKYLLGKEFGDDRLTGQATGTMQNTGLIPGMFSGIEDLVRGGAKKLGANVQVHERHNPVVDAELTADLFPDPEENEGEAANYLKGAQRYASGSVEDQVRAKAAQAYADAGIGFDEERFQKDFVLSNGKIKAKEDLPDHIRNQYLKTEKEFKELAGQASNKELKDEVDLRQHMKKRGIDKIKEFTGPHSNMRNQNKKYHKDLVDFYVKRKDWDKAQEVQDAYVQNEMNLDKHWGDKGRKNYDSLFQRPSRGGTGKQDYMTVQINGEDKNISIPERLRNNPRAIRSHLANLHGEAWARQYDEALKNGTVQYMSGAKDTNPLTGDMVLAGEANIADKLTKAREEQSSGLFGNYRNKTKDAEINRQLAYTGQNQIFVDGALKNKSLLTGRDVTKIASGMGQDPLELALSLAQQTRKPLVQFLDSSTKRDAIAAGIIDKQGRPISAGN